MREKVMPKLETCTEKGEARISKAEKLFKKTLNQESVSDVDNIRSQRESCRFNRAATPSLMGDLKNVKKLQMCGSTRGRWVGYIFELDNGKAEGGFRILAGGRGLLRPFFVGAVLSLPVMLN